MKFLYFNKNRNRLGENKEQIQHKIIMGTQNARQNYR